MEKSNAQAWFYSHWCEIGDNLDQYGWNQHDGKTFGIQKIDDHPFSIETSFVKFPGGRYGGDWTARITVTNSANNSNEPLSLIWYTAMDDKTGGIITTNTHSKLTGIRGETPGLGEFKLDIRRSNGTIIHQSHLSTVTPNLQVQI